MSPRWTAGRSTVTRQLRSALVRLVAGLGATIGGAVGLGGGSPEFARQPPPPATGPIRFAFNGRDLDGFSTFLRYQHEADPAHVFAVRDGSLCISGAEFGGIATRDSFADYHLVAEWRWGGPTHYPRRWRARNSGILIHATGAEGDGLGSWMASYETQLIEGGCGDLLIVPGAHEPPRSLRASVRTGADGQPYFRPGGEVVTRERGRINWWGRDPRWNDVLWFRGADDPDRPVGEWNRTDLICAGDRVRCYLNGRLVNAADGLSVRSGRVLLQSEGAEIHLRRFEIRALAVPPR